MSAEECTTNPYNVETARVRVAFTMLRSNYDALKAESNADGETIASHLRKAIATHRYVKDCQRRGAKIIVRNGDVQQEVIFR